MGTFAHDQWYVAAFGSEIGAGLFARTVLGEPIVFYRTGSGAVAALSDRCVHRRYPLSLGHLDGERLVCGYHGFTYQPDGRCVAVPGQTRVPRTARVPPYPVVERDSFVWVWIGDPALADPAAVPRAPWLADPRYATVCGMEPLAARWELLVDNLLDSSRLATGAVQPQLRPVAYYEIVARARGARGEGGAGAGGGGPASRTCAPLSAYVLGWPAAARRDCAGHDRGTGDRRGGRAGLGARCLDPGSDSQSVHGSPAALRGQFRVHLAQSVGGRTYCA